MFLSSFDHPLMDATPEEHPYCHRQALQITFSIPESGCDGCRPQQGSEVHKVHSHHNRVLVRQGLKRGRRSEEMHSRNSKSKARKREHQHSSAVILLTLQVLCPFSEDECTYLFPLCFPQWLGSSPKYGADGSR